MSINFKNIDYLKDESKRQQLAWNGIKKYNMLALLKKYNPILRGRIDLPESELDIRC